MPEIIQKPVVASNYYKGRFNISKQPVKPDMIVIHVAVATLQGTFNTFNNPTEQKSSHYCVGEAGEIWQFVADEDNAWHAGFIVNPTSALVKMRIGSYPSPNAYTIGIENAGEYVGDSSPGEFTAAQYESNGWLVAQLSKKWSIPLDRVHIIGHREIRSDKTCPGQYVSIDRILAIAQKYLTASQPVDKTQQMKKDIMDVLAKY